MSVKVIKRDKQIEDFNPKKVESVLKKVFKKTGHNAPVKNAKEVTSIVINKCLVVDNDINVEKIQDIIRDTLIELNYPIEAKEFILYRNERAQIRKFVKEKEDFINKFKKSNNAANSTVDDNSNVSSKNIGVLNNEIHKSDNIQVSRGMVTNKLKQLFPDFDHKSYIKDLESHIIYKHDESSFAGAFAPYCVSISMYPFLIDGLKNIGGLSAAPKNLDSFCGMYINLIFAVSAQYAGAVATSEFFVYFDYFARKKWGDHYYKYAEGEQAKHRWCEDENGFVIDEGTIGHQIHQYFQQVVYSINQPAAARGLQAAFVNFSYFDKAFFEGMFGNFYFPDGTQPKWDSLNWLQKYFMKWFNEERTKTMLSFPVESFALVNIDGKWVDEESANFVAEEYARGHSFFTYISDTIDSLSSCCRLKNKIQTKEFNFTNGNMGIMTGSKSVITLNLNRIVQDSHNKWLDSETSNDVVFYDFLKSELCEILERVYKYHTAYNELLKDVYEANLLPVYSAGFIDLNKQYLTIGLNGLNEAAEFLGMECRPDDEDYKQLCQIIFSTIKEQNTAHKTKELTFNTEQVPAESLAIKNYNWDKEDGYIVPEDRNLYASYIYIPSDEKLSVLDKIKMHGSEYIGEYLDGGSAAHINLAEHLSSSQYRRILDYAVKVGCQYLTFNIPNSECQNCSYITKVPIKKCPKCGSEHISYYDRVIGYLTKIDNWSEGRQIEQKTRVYVDAKESI